MKVFFETTEHIAFVTLNHTSRELIEELATVFESIAENKNLRVVILTGVSELSAENSNQVSEQEKKVCELIKFCSVPVIAVINGTVAGYGCKLILSCHLRIASQDSEFYLPKTRLGNKKIKADEALRIGLVNRVLPSSDILNQAISIARIISSLAPLAVRACLRAVVDGYDLSLHEGLNLEAKLFSELFATEDMREGTSAFLEKRQPVFQGK